MESQDFDEDIYTLQKKCTLLSVSLFEIGCLCIDSQMQDEQTLESLKKTIEEIYAVVVESHASLEKIDGVTLN